MNIIEFVSQFPNEASCRSHFKESREKEGVVCKNCRSVNHWWLKAKSQWQCTQCDFRTTLRSGTIMESSKLPVRTWYLAMAFMCSTKKGLSACELQRQLGHSRYGTIWRLMHKIRTSMGNRESDYLLRGEIEFDEGFFPIEHPKKTFSKYKAGKGSEKKKNVAVLAESTPLENIEEGRLGSQCRYFKMQVLSNHQASAIDELIEDSIQEKSIVFSDQSKSYVNIEDYVEIHVSEKSSRSTTVDMLHWVHLAICNAKRMLSGIYHKVKGKYLQAYLDEFCYKLNRRNWGDKLFDRLIIAVCQNNWYLCE